jgi:uncharacterized protein (DUF1778 family)
MPAIKEERLNLRLSTSDDALIRAAAATVGTSVSDYVTQSAIECAHRVLADQRRFNVDEETWNRFLEALDRPAKVNKRLAALLRRPSLLDGQD